MSQCTARIREELFQLQDTKYRDFQAKLIPTVDVSRMIGVRTPDLRALAKREIKEPDVDEFLASLPHEYFDENQLHAFIVSAMKDFDGAVRATEAFLPYVDNWATCDQMSPKVFKKRRADLIPYIEGWLRSEETYTVRFGIGMLMEHFLDEDFEPRYLEMVAALRSEEYYVNMMIAWYFATALAKQYELALPVLQERRLDAWTHNKTIRKALESYRITKEQKEYLKTLKQETIRIS